jgi:outer membrane translocation and assembly module TamA
MQAEWRILVNSFIDTAVFFDAGKVASRKSDLDFDDLHTDVGFGIRLHGPLATPLRIEIARGSEGFNLVFAASATF